MVMDKPLASTNAWKLTMTGGWQAVPGLEVPGMATVLAWEARYRGPSGQGTDRIVAGNVGHIRIVLDFAGYGLPQPWSDIVALASKQANKVQEAQSPVGIGQ